MRNGSFGSAGHLSKFIAPTTVSAVPAERRPGKQQMLHTPHFDKTSSALNFSL